MSHGLDIAVVAVASGCVLAWSLVSARLERWDVSAPIAFVVRGSRSSGCSHSWCSGWW